MKTSRKELEAMGESPGDTLRYLAGLNSLLNPFRGEFTEVLAVEGLPVELAPGSFPRSPKRSDLR